MPADLNELLFEVAALEAASTNALTLFVASLLLAFNPTTKYVPSLEPAALNVEPLDVITLAMFEVSFEAAEFNDEFDCRPLTKLLANFEPAVFSLGPKLFIGLIRLSVNVWPILVTFSLDDPRFPIAFIKSFIPVIMVSNLTPDSFFIEFATDFIPSAPDVISPELENFLTASDSVSNSLPKFSGTVRPTHFLTEVAISPRPVADSVRVEAPNPPNVKPLTAPATSFN